MNDFLQTLESIVGAAGLVKDKSSQQTYLKEWRERAFGQALAIVRPSTTEEVSAVLSTCHQQRVGVVPQGGNTGLCGGAIPDASASQVVLSLNRMRSILSTQADNYSMTVEAGCTLDDVRRAAAAVGRRFGLSLASEGTATIGGNIATNAGGIHVIRYGMMREQVLGLEVVLADGTRWDGLRELGKNTAGYDLKQAFIGSEGTLGVITRAVLRLQPQAVDSACVLAGVESFEAAVKLGSRLREKLGDQLSALEVLSNRALEFVLRYSPGSRAPFSTRYPYLVLLDVETMALHAQQTVHTALNDIMESGLIQDAIVAKNAAEAERLWALRHQISAAQKPEGLSLKHDVCVPVSRLAEFHLMAEQKLDSAINSVRPVVFGHLGDGNLHYNVSRPVDMSDAEFSRQRDTVAQIVYSSVLGCGGSVCAEHGVGEFKRDDFEQAVSPIERNLMLRIKTALDPAGIMNPGKIFAAEINKDITRR